MRSLHLSHCFVPVLAFLFVLSGLSAYGQDEPTAAQIAEWRKHAVQGEAYTQYNLGIVLKHGKGAVKDEAEGVRWFRKATIIFSITTDSENGKEEKSSLLLLNFSNLSR